MINDKQIKILVEKGKLRKRSPDRRRAETLIKAAFNRAEFAKSIPINDKTATGIFNEMYEAFHHLGNAKWWILGYKPEDHAVAMLILSGAEISKSYKVQNIDRFRLIRNDANYEGYIVRPDQAKEIVALWNDVSEELIEWVRK